MNNELEQTQKLPDYLNWYLKSRGITLDMIKKSIEKIEPVEESRGRFKRREFEQTQELLVGLTNILFSKIEEMNLTVKEVKPEEIKTKIDDLKIEESNQPKEGSKFEFSDISWFKTKMDEISKEKGDS